MSSTHPKRKRSIWQALGLYLAGSWICLQVVDVLGQNITLPDWTFLLTLVLLLIGLPITAATAYLQSRAQEGEGHPGRRPASQQLLTWPNVVRGGIGAMAVWGVAVTGWLLLGRDQVSEGRILEQIEDVDRLVGESNFPDAYALVAELEDDIRDADLREELWSKVAMEVTVETEPSGATVYRRGYTASSEWEEMGETPVTIRRFPNGASRVRFELDGYMGRELVRAPEELQGVPIELVPDGTYAPGMRLITGAAGNEGYGLFVPGLEQLPNLELAPFLMSRTEVTNREFADFIDAGGYSDPTCWEESFAQSGVPLSFDDVVARFTDTTGQPGPSTWDAGTYPAGAADLPVGGVSWYEAAAYACFVGMSLPTVYHWYAAANPFISHFVVPLSNYGAGPAPVMEYQGVSLDGIYDLAGNVREWAANATGDSHLILGGGWGDQPYSFNDAVTAPSLDRSPLNGIRLVQYLDTTNIAAAGAPLELAFRDYRVERPVSDEVFDVFLQAYAYDDTPLNARVVGADTTELAIVERIEMDAAYGGDRLTTFLFRPPGVEAPLQTVVFFPGSGDIYRRSYTEVRPGAFDFLLRSGRAVAYPMYLGTFERGTGLRSDIQDQSNNWRDHMLAWSQDLRRTIDYLATREDVDMERLGYLGISWGGAVAPVMLATEDRIRAAVIIVGGLLMQETQPMADPFHFLPRVRQPTVMVNARYDSFYPLETSGRPFFDYLGAPDDQKRFVVIDANHGVLSYARNQVVGEALSWLDEYLGPVR
jgi:dienelactone hydrolase